MDVEVLGAERDVVLGALLDLAEQLRHPQVALGEVVGVVADAGHRVHAGEGDDRERNAQRAKRAAESHREG